MQAAVEVVWWIGLLGALLATLVVLKQVTLVLRTLHHIHVLAERTRRSAEALAAHVAASSRLGELHAPAAALRDAADDVAAAIGGLAGHLDGAATAHNPGE